MVITAILAGLAAIGAALLVDEAERQKPVLQPVRARGARNSPKSRS
ncbi:MAG: hypothetical protein H7249_20040 [Chitinophagaceae bacterium]|nr:hypothetical protein [Oligoflexus sp.]